jgi:nucleoid-associated protein YgaU
MAKDNERAAPSVDANTLKENEVARAVMGTGVKAEGFRVDFRGGVASLTGTVRSEDERRRIYDAARGVAGVSSVTDNLRIGGGATSGSGGSAPFTGAATAAAGSASAGGRTYTVKSGDTLSKIAKSHYGDASKYNRIFEANRNILNDPDKIKPGQVLNIPE